MNIDFFARPEVAPLWAETMNSKVRPYLEPLTNGRKHGGMMLWWVPIKESQHCSILKKDLTYEQNASLLIAACPGCFQSLESLKASFNTVNKGNHTTKRDEWLDQYGPHIRKMLISSIPQPRPVLSAESTILDVVKEIAEKLVDESYNRRSSFVRCGQEFTKFTNKVCPPVAIVTYPDAEAIRQDEPSSVVSFEHVDGELTADRVHIYNSLYAPFGGRHHLVLVARSVADDRVVQICEEKDFGLCIVNPDGTWNRILSRTVNDFTAIAAARHALFGGNSEKRLIAYHRQFTTLPEMLNHFDVSVKQKYRLRRPILSKQDIKQITANRLHEIGCNMNGYCVTNKNLTDIARLLGVTFSFGYLPDYQLEKCDLDANEITINLSLIANDTRGRFTLSHGLGHFDMQESFLDEFTYSFDVNTQTIIDTSSPRNYWGWLEWQANNYGRYTLMPDDIMYNLIERCYKPQTFRMSPLIVNNDQGSQEVYYTTLRKMSELSKVSIQALTNRLIEMGKLVDNRTNKPTYTPATP